MKTKEEKLATILIAVGLMWTMLALSVYKQIYWAIPGLILEFIGVYVIINHRVKQRELNKLIPQFISVGLILGMVFTYLIFIAN
jgi:uncharacterized membrane protein YidH (DUF202 family)